MRIDARWASQDIGNCSDPRPPISIRHSPRMKRRNHQRLAKNARRLRRRKQQRAHRVTLAGFFFGPISATIRLDYRRPAAMPSAIEQIVNVFVSLGNRRRLEDMKLQRERAVIELQSQLGVSLPIRQLEGEIAVIDAGLEKLPPTGSTA